MMKKFTIKIGIVLTVLFTAMISHAQINPAEVKYWVGSGTDTAYLALKPTSAYDQTAKVWGYLHDGTKTIDDLVQAIGDADANLTVFKSTEIDTIQMHPSQWGYGLEGKNTATASWNIFSSTTSLTGWTAGSVLTDALINHTVYGVAFNSDETTNTTNPEPSAPYAYQENPTYHDASIAKVRYFVGAGDKQTVVLVDFKNENYKNSLAFGVNFTDGETLGNALEKIQTAYTDFSYDAGAFLNDITFDTLTKENGVYWSILANDLTDQLGSNGTGVGLSQELAENSYYAFVISKYSPSYLIPVSYPTTTAIAKDSSAIVAWATGATVTRGFIQIDDETKEYNGSTKATHGASSDVIGVATGSSVVSLGDRGEAIVTFGTPITDGEGYDFAVFENSFNATFLELAFVEVSSDGVNYFRFPSVSLTDTTTQVDGFGSVDARNIHNLAGKYKAGFGTPFDLKELAGTAGLDINAVTHVKIIDAVGAINPLFASRDSQGNIINDPYATPYNTSGFDLDAIAVLNEGTINALSSVEGKQLLVYPNPAIETVTISLKAQTTVSIYTMNGILVYSEDLNEGVNSLSIETLGLTTGMYFLKAQGRSVTKLLVK